MQNGGADGTWVRWRQARPPLRGVHLDNAAAGRSAESVLAAVAAHTLLEAQVGAYVAEEQAAPVLAAGRAAIAGLLGVPTAGLAFLESASAARAALLAAWPLSTGDTVAVVPSEWGPALEAFHARGLEIVELAAHGDGTVDLVHLERLLVTSPPRAVHLTQVVSHRGLVQPVAQAAALCRPARVALWVDAAQALGHVDTATDADAVYATSRKWLTGPRGVGVLGIAGSWWPALRVHRPAMAAPEMPAVELLESREAHLAGRLGLCVAARDYLQLGPAAVGQRLGEVGRLTREALDGLAGWQVVDPPNAPSAITALRPTGGQNVAATRARLIRDHQIVTTVAGTARAPREMTQPLLRLSPHVDCAPNDLDRLRAALATS